MERRNGSSLTGKGVFKRHFAFPNSTHTDFRLLPKVLMMQLFNNYSKFWSRNGLNVLREMAKAVQIKMKWNKTTTTTTTRRRKVMKDPRETRLMDGCLEVDKGTEHQVGNGRLWFAHLPLKGPYIRCSPCAQRLHPPIPLSNFLSSLRS